MTIGNILHLLDSLSPLSLQEKWDNSGLILGREEDTFEKIFLTLELDRQVLDIIPENSLLITHHPILFTPIKNLHSNTYPSNIITEFIRKKCYLLSWHTNFDSSHLNIAFAKKLGLKEGAQKQGVYICPLQEDIDIRALATHIKKSLAIKTLKITDAKKPIKTLALVCGSGMSLLELVKDTPNLCFITGDIKYHQAMEALSLGISLIDVGHYESEKHFPQILQGILQKEGYEVIIADSKNPFEYL